MKLLVVLALIGSLTAERLYSESFSSFIETHKKSYETDDEHNLRYWTFYKNMAKWELLNEFEQGTATYGPTVFADLSEKEFRERYLSPVTEKDMWYLTRILSVAQPLDTSAIPTSVDWREKNAVTDVKNQGECGSCWAFSTTGNIEGRHAIKTGQLVSLSEQELVDCDKVDLGCNGGLPYQAYEEIMRIGGLVGEEDYPYKGRKGTCEFQKSEVKATITGREKVSTDEDQIAAYVNENGPVSIGINANAMQFYTGGISDPFSFLCNPNHLDHGVLITGYGVDNGEKFWTIKNSWGPNWGEKGYYRVKRGKGVCGLNKMVTSAIV